MLYVTMDRNNGKVVDTKFIYRHTDRTGNDSLPYDSG